jgi:hypothetical protein
MLHQPMFNFDALFIVAVLQKFLIWIKNLFLFRLRNRIEIDTIGKDALILSIKKFIYEILMIYVECQEDSQQLDLLLFFLFLL